MVSMVIDWFSNLGNNLLGGEITMTESKQTEANKRWQEKNREHARYLRNRSTARNFVKKQANRDDIDELKELIKQREIELSDSPTN